GGEGGGEHGCTVQSHPPATVRGDDDALPHSRLPLPAIVPAASEVQKLEQEQQTAPSLPEGAIVEILSRVPYRSLCRFKCVSKPWLALCSAPDIRKRSPQTLSGFFYKNARVLHFRNLNGRGPPLVDPSLPFLRLPEIALSWSL
uniref:F-box domain-containing protein n=1 Tax=Aegilops tauschii subsp. strangulata TaxID=200361 RepID=A0A452ZYG9_AEGTS